LLSFSIPYIFCHKLKTFILVYYSSFDMKINTILFLALVFFTACKNEDSSGSEAYKSWGVFNGNWTSNKYSSLAQIDTTNVQQLQVAWE